MKYFLYNKKDGEVKSVSEGKIIFDENIFILKSFNLTENELELLQQGKSMRIRNDELEFYDKEK